VLIFSETGWTLREGNNLRNEAERLKKTEKAAKFKCVAVMSEKKKIKMVKLSLCKVLTIFCPI